MVVDPQNCRPLSGLMFEQRFNVAASRARDRMYLVRSVTASDLSDRDIRAGLLAHFDKPLAAESQESESLLDRCESEFEREVYNELVSRGFRVTPYLHECVSDSAGDLARDPEIARLLELERRRQQENIELIASENFTSPAVMEAQGSVLTNKYAEGYPKKRWYGGCENVDAVDVRIEALATGAGSLSGAAPDSRCPPG